MTSAPTIEGANNEAVREGYAYSKQRMQSTKNYHAISDTQRRRYYLCGCAAPMLLGGGYSNLARKRRQTSRWCDGRYSLKSKLRSRVIDRHANEKE